MVISKSMDKLRRDAGKDAATVALHMTTQELRESVDLISAILIGNGVGDVERPCLNEERRAFRAEIANRSPRPPSE